MYSRYTLAMCCWYVGGGCDTVALDALVAVADVYGYVDNNLSLAVAIAGPVAVSYLAVARGCFYNLRFLDGVLFLVCYLNDQS